MYISYSEFLHNIACVYSYTLVSLLWMVVGNELAGPELTHIAAFGL